MDKYVATVTISLFLVVAIISFGFVALVESTTVDWHDTGTVTGVQTHTVWDAGVSDFINYYTANVTTLQHGVLHFDSRKGCGFVAVVCANNEINSMKLGDLLGVIHQRGGTILVKWIGTQ